MSSTHPPLSFYSDPKHQPYRLGQSAHRALLVHGFMGTPAEMRYLGEAMAATGWQARCDTLPGFGAEAPQLGQMRKADWLAAVESAWRDEMYGASTRVLIGFSMGGALATILAETLQPDYLVLIAPFTEMSLFLARLLPVARFVIKEFKPFEQADFSNPDVRKQFYEMSPEIDVDDPAVQARLRNEIALPTVVLEQVRQLGRMAVHAAPRVRVPTLILQGRDDDTVRPKSTRRLITRWGGPVQYLELPGGHELPKQAQPSDYRFAPDVLNFLPQLEPATPQQ